MKKIIFIVLLVILLFSVGFLAYIFIFIAPDETSSSNSALEGQAETEPEEPVIEREERTVQGSVVRKDTALWNDVEYHRVIISSENDEQIAVLYEIDYQDSCEASVPAFHFIEEGQTVEAYGEVLLSEAEQGSVIEVCDLRDYYLNVGVTSSQQEGETQT